MAVITKNKNFFKWPKAIHLKTECLLIFKPELRNAKFYNIYILLY